MTRAMSLLEPCPHDLHDMWVTKGSLNVGLGEVLDLFFLFSLPHPHRVGRAWLSPQHLPRWGTSNEMIFLVDGDHTTLRAKSRLVILEEDNGGVEVALGYC